MTVFDRSSEVSGRGGRAAPKLARPALVAIGLALIVTIVWGGYGHHWPWTGINGRTARLWEWLNLLLLPVAVGVLPIWVSRRGGLGRRHLAVVLGALSILVLLVVLGYTVPWAWTGFVGNTLWDWLNLLALPFAVALLPVYHQIYHAWRPRHTTWALIAFGVFLIPVLGGYFGDWRWTGFHGNTLWDWLHLLLLPLLLPAVIVPTVVARQHAGRTPSDAEPRGPRRSSGHPVRRSD